MGRSSSPAVNAILDADLFVNALSMFEPELGPETDLIEARSNLMSAFAEVRDTINERARLLARCEKLGVAPPPGPACPRMLDDRFRNGTSAFVRFDRAITREQMRRDGDA